MQHTHPTAKSYTAHTDSKRTVSDTIIATDGGVIRHEPTTLTSDIQAARTRLNRVRLQTTDPHVDLQLEKAIGRLDVALKAVDGGEGDDR